MRVDLAKTRALSVGLAHRVTYAFLLASVSFGLWVLPLDFDAAIAGPVARAINLPVALAGWLLPLELRGLDTWFDRSLFDTGNPVGTLLAHLRNAIPVYVLLFYVPHLIRGGRNWLRRRREGAASDPLPAASR